MKVALTEKLKDMRHEYLLARTTRDQYIAHTAELKQEWIDACAAAVGIEYGKTVIIVNHRSSKARWLVTRARGDYGHENPVNDDIRLKLMAKRILKDGSLGEEEREIWQSYEIEGVK